MFAVLVMPSTAAENRTVLPAETAELPGSDSGGTLSDPPWSPSARPLSADEVRVGYPSDGTPTWDAAPGYAPALSSAIDRHGFPAAWAQGFRGQGANIAIVDQGVDFGHPDLDTSYAVLSDPGSPYDGWPIAFDSKSLATYLDTGFVDGTWYANTTRTGAGPFEVTHTLLVDGTSDFGETERLGADPRDNSAGSPGGDKEDFDLTDLYTTRDATRWFFGFSGYLREANNSYVLLIDTDNETAGTTTVPAGKLANTETSHADIVTDIAIRPDGQRVATVSADRFLRIWDRNGGLLFSVQAHAAKPSSVSWSPDGTRIATADPNVLLIWDAGTGTVLRSAQYVPLGNASIDENGVLAWSPDSTRVAAGTSRYVHVIDAAAGTRVGAVWGTNSAVNGVRYNLAGTQIALALGDGTIGAFDLNATNLQPYPPATRAIPAFTLSGGHADQVLDLAWSSDNTRLVSGGRDNAVVLWDVPSRSVVASSTVSAARVTGVEWRKDGFGFVSVSEGLLPGTPPKLIYWTSAGSPVLTVNQVAAMSGVDTSVLGEVGTSSHDLSGRLWNLGGTQLRVFVAHRVDYALVVDGWSRYSDRDQSFSHGLDVGTFYRWNATGLRWDGASFFDPAVDAEQASFQFGERLFNEISVPRSVLGDPAAVSVELFTAGRGPTRPQDTAPTDPNVNFRNLDLSGGTLSLGAFAYRRPGSYSVDPGIVSASGSFHFGYHPSPVLTRLFGPVGLLVADSASPGAYDAVYVDLDNDRRFETTDVRLDRANPVASIDTIDGTTGLPGQDGIADVSGGLLYFLADGVTPIPYSDRYVARQVATNPDLVNRVPGNGDFVAFVGEFGLDPVTGARAEHGTRIASLVVGRARLTPPVAGVADGAKLIAIGNALNDIVSSWYFAVEGYDGVPNTGDEADVVLNPFTVTSSPSDGFDVLSRTADFLSAIHSQGDAVFVAPAGDHGFGYGSLAAPASAPAVLAVGRAEDGTSRSAAEGGPEGPNPHYLDVAAASARGPTALGTPKPDLIAIGTATADLPLHSAPADGTTAVGLTPLTGTDVAAAVAAGAAAIVRQAFLSSAGRAPSYDEVAAILRSAASDESYDPFVQGSGFLDVAEAVRIARRAGGLLVSPSTLLPGAYRGLRAAAFPHLIAPGGSDSLPLRIENRGASPTTVSLSDAVYARFATYTLTASTVQDLYSANGDITFWLNDTGVSKVDGGTLGVVQVLPPVPGAWTAADLVKLTATSDVDGLVFKIGTAYETNYSYTLSARDWEVNGTNWAGLPYGPFPAPALFPGELNTVSSTAHQSNVLEVRVREPAATLRDGLVVHLGESSSGLGKAGVNWTFTVEMYRRADWVWVTPAPGSVSIPGGGNATVSIDLTVPGTTGLGLYQGFVLVTNTSSGRTSQVPLVVNVAGSGPNFRFGGDAASSDLYDNSRVFGGNDFALRNDRIARPYLGDWRFYYVDIPDSGMFVNPRGLKILVDLDWDEKPSDLDIQAFGRTPADPFSTNRGDRYGPAPAALRARTEEIDKPEFLTLTNESEDILAFDLQPGLNLVGVHGTRLKGGAPAERITGVAGWVRVRPSVDVATPDLAGDAGFTFLSGLDLPGGLRASAVGPAQTASLLAEEIPQDWQSWWNFPNWGEFMIRGSFSHVFRLEKALILEVHLVGAPDVSDLDLAVFRDLNEDGLLTVDEVQDANSRRRGGNDWDWDADGDADERVRWISPPDGQYIVKVLGFTVNADPGHFDLDISVTLDTGKGYEIPQAPKPAEIVQGTEGGLLALESVDFSMAWDFPGDTRDGDYGGAVLLGLPGAPGVLVIPVNIGLDRVAPVVTSFTLSSPTGLVNDADGRTTNDVAPRLVWTLADGDRGELDSTRVQVTVDGLDVTPDAEVDIRLLANSLGALGFWEGTVVYTPKGLQEGAHDVRLVAGDLAGNLVPHDTTLVLDRISPAVALEGPRLRFTRAPLATVTAISEPGAFVSFGGPWIPVDGTGRVTTTLSLAEGRNPVRVASADWFDADPVTGDPRPGNSDGDEITVVYDVTPPSFSRAPSPSASLTREDGIVVRGIVQDLIAPATPWPARDVAIVVAGRPAGVAADGTFEVTVLLSEGPNTIEVLATDPAGNVARRWANATRDSLAPALEVDPIPAQVFDGRVVVSGTTDPGTIVSVNGIVVPVVGTAFSRNVTLSGGETSIVVRAEDGAGNFVEERYTVTYAVPPPSRSVLYGAGVGGGILAAILVFFLARRFLFPPSVGTGVREQAGAAGARAEVEEPSPEAVPPPSETAPVSGPPAEDPDERKLEEALDDLEELEEGLEKEAEDPRIARLREALESNKITREVYEENMRRIRKSP